MRYIPHTPPQIQEMLKIIGRRSVEDLFASIPENLRLKGNLKLPPPLDEMNLLGHLESLAQENETPSPNKSFLGGGVYRHYIPSAVTALISRSEFLTPYTPYQPEIAQGTLQIMYEFQTMIVEIFGMEVANASLYDGSTALTEAILMALRIGKNRKNVLLPKSLHPEYRETVQTTLRTLGANLIDLPMGKTFDSKAADLNEACLSEASLNDYLNDELACWVVPYPDFFGIVNDVRLLVEKVHQAGGLVIFCVPEPLSLGLMESPGAMGADIVCGEGQSFGLSPSFGGPFAGLFATRKEFLRQMPGRLCGMTTDKSGRRGFVLTLSTREQHIRREKATSNICTNQALCATQVTMYLSLLGKEGLAKLARLNWERSEYAKEKLSQIPGVLLPFDKAATFNEFVITLPKPVIGVLQELKKKGFEGGIRLNRWFREPNLANALLVNVTEMNGKEDIDMMALELRSILQS